MPRMHVIHQLSQGDVWCRNRVKGLLAGPGIYDFDPLGADLMRDLAETAHE